MKRTLILFVAFFVALGMAGVFNEALGQTVANVNTKGVIMAQDSSLTNSGTSASSVISLIAKKDDYRTSVNYLAAASVLVTGKQASDSVYADVYVRVGKISGGTAKSTYADVLVDSLKSTKTATVVDLSKYLTFDQLAIVVKGRSAGNGASATWSAIFGGVGKPVVPY